MANTGSLVDVSYTAAVSYTITCGATTCTAILDPYCGCTLFDDGVLRDTYYATINLTSNSLTDCEDCGDERCPDVSGTFAVSGASGCAWDGGLYGSGAACTHDGDLIIYPKYRVKLETQNTHPNTGALDGNHYAILYITYSVVDPPPCSEGATFWKLIGADVDKPFSTDLMLGSYAQRTGTAMCDGDATVS